MNLNYEYSLILLKDGSAYSLSGDNFRARWSVSLVLLSVQKIRDYLQSITRLDRGKTQRYCRGILLYERITGKNHMRIDFLVSSEN